jgi:hypothetical protein
MKTLPYKKIMDEMYGIKKSSIPTKVDKFSKMTLVNKLQRSLKNSPVRQLVDEILGEKND